MYTYMLHLFRDPRKNRTLPAAEGLNLVIDRGALLASGDMIWAQRPEDYDHMAWKETERESVENIFCNNAIIPSDLIG